MIDSSIPIALVTDNNYIMPTMVCLQSMIANKNKRSYYKIYIFTDNITEQSAKMLQGFSEQFFEIELLEVDNKYKFFKNTNSYITNSTFIRFDIPNILSQYDKILYLDVDMIIQKDLSELYNTEIGNMYAGVVCDVGDSFYNLTGRTNVEKYFNAGMILYNAKKYRENGLCKKLVDIYTKQPKKLLLMDQDALNIAFNNQIKILSPIYNFQQSCCEYWQKDVLKYYNIQVNDIKLENIVIIHYTRMKPWIYKSTYLKSQWDLYYMQTSLSCNKLKLKNGYILRLYLSLRGRFRLQLINSIIKKLRNAINA